MSLTSLILMILTFLVNFVIHFAFWWIMDQLAQPFYSPDPLLPVGQEMDYVARISCISILVPAVFFSIGPMQRFLVWSEGGRVATGEWKARMERALWEICERAHLKPSDYRLYVAQSQAPNAFALGNRHIAVTAGAMQYLDDRELVGIMAHEMGHLQKGHTRAGLFIVGMNWFGRIIAWVYLMMNVLCRLVLWIPFLGWLVAIVMTLINLQYTLCQILLQMPANLLMYGGQRKEEYEADRYACTIGLGKELERGLMDLEAYYGERKLGFLERLYTDHPETKKRLLRIRKYNNEE
ncbi:MAG TPA: hypothetical protein DDY92_00135 [Dialister sp.]|nr:hypothetical protein [Dialister sp.]